MVPTADAPDETAREFATRFAADAVDAGAVDAATDAADAAELLSEDGRESVVESFPGEFQQPPMDAENALEQYWWGLYSQYGEPQDVTVVGVEDDVVTVEFVLADGTQTADVTVGGDGVADLSFPTGYEEPDYVDERAFAERDVTVEAGTVETEAVDDGATESDAADAENPELDGILAVPDDDGPFPAVLLVHGAGIHDPDGTAGASKILRDLGRGLASRGVATLRYEKRLNEHDVAPEDHDLDTIVVDDAVAAFDRLAAADEVDDSALFVAGHSQGGMCAPRVAERYGGVAGVVSLDGPAETGIDPDDVDLMRYSMEPDGDLSEEQAAALAEQRQAVERIASGDFDADETVLGSPGALWESRRELDPTGTTSDLDAALFVAKTERVDHELQADIGEQRRESFEEWQVVDAGDDDRFEYYEDVGHYFQDGPVPATMTALYFGGNVAEYVVDDVTDWVTSVVDE